MDLTGIHHLTAITADAPANNRFYTQTLGLRRVKKTVNQDDTSAYHLFFANGAGSAGSDLTFFDWPVGRERRGTRSISRTTSWSFSRHRRPAERIRPAILSPALWRISSRTSFP